MGFSKMILLFWLTAYTTVENGYTLKFVGESKGPSQLTNHDSTTKISITDHSNQDNFDDHGNKNNFDDQNNFDDHGNKNNFDDHGNKNNFDDQNNFDDHGNKNNFDDQNNFDDHGNKNNFDDQNNFDDHGNKNNFDDHGNIYNFDKQDNFNDHSNRKNFNGQSNQINRNIQGSNSRFPPLPQPQSGFSWIPNGLKPYLVFIAPPDSARGNPFFNPFFNPTTPRPTSFVSFNKIGLDGPPLSNLEKPVNPIDFREPDNIRRPEIGRYLPPMLRWNLPPTEAIFFVEDSVFNFSR